MMKLLVQGDDFGFTRGTTFGGVDCIDFGVLRNTGLFANMPSAKLAVSYMADRPQVCFGIDFNIVTGPSVSDPSSVPDLVDESGEFIRSNVRIHDPRWQSEAGRREMFPLEQVRRELWAQYNRFVELTGKKPGYLHAHSISSEPYEETIHEISAATGIPYSFDVIQKFHIVSAWDKVDPMADKASGKKVFDPTAQLSKDSFSINVADVSDYLLSHEYAMVLGHPGYVDADLMGRTSLSLERMRDAEMMMSQQFKDWIREHHVQLITYRDLVEEE